MSQPTHLLKRLGIAKALGFVVGLLGFILIPTFWPEVSQSFRFGILLWYTTFGVMIGYFGIIDVHPLFKFRLPFWLRGSIFGGWLNFVLALMMWEQLAGFLALTAIGMSSPRPIHKGLRTLSISVTPTAQTVNSTAGRGAASIHM